MEEPCSVSGSPLTAGTAINPSSVCAAASCSISVQMRPCGKEKQSATACLAGSRTLSACLGLDGYQVASLNQAKRNFGSTASPGTCLPASKRGVRAHQGWKAPPQARPGRNAGLSDHGACHGDPPAWALWSRSISLRVEAAGWIHRRTGGMRRTKATPIYKPKDLRAFQLVSAKPR